MNPAVQKPHCPKCKKPMRLVAAGRTARDFCCMGCKEKITIEREGPRELVSAVMGGEE